jgi:hypothetical protein
MEFTTSKSELSRRKKAFITLLVSIYVGSFLASKFFNYPISIIGYLSLALVFFLVGILTFQFLNSISKIKIRLSDKKIERTTGRVSESFFLSDIQRIKVKARTNGIIREIYIWFSNRRNLFMTAFEKDFNRFKDVLAGKISKDIVVEEVREPINYDHPLFYPILGLLISFAGIYFLKYITFIDYSKLKTIFFIFSVYAFALAIYFILIKPISKRSGAKQTVVDYIIGLIIVCSSIFIFIIGLRL